METRRVTASNPLPPSQCNGHLCNYPVQRPPMDLDVRMDTHTLIRSPEILLVQFMHSVLTLYRDMSVLRAPSQRRSAIRHRHIVPVTSHVTYSTSTWSLHGKHPLGVWEPEAPRDLWKTTPYGCRRTMRAPVLQDMEEGLHTMRLTVAG